MADIVGDMPGKNALVGTLSSQNNLVGTVSQLSGGYDRGYEEGEKVGYTNGYEIGAKEGAEVGYAKGKTDAETNAIALVNEGIAGSGAQVEEADSIDQIPNKIQDVYGFGRIEGYQFGEKEGYKKGKTDGEDNALDAFNLNLQGTGIEYAESVDEIDGKFEEATQQQYDKGVEIGRIEGKQAEYDAFWDAYQQNGNRTDYQNGFCGEGWTEETYKPKYDIFTTNSYMLFRRTGIKDLGAAIRNSGKKVTTSHTYLQFTFQQSPYLESIDGIEFTVPLIYISGAFSYCNVLRKIQTLPIAENATTLDFTYIPALEDVSFSGVIPVNISFAQSGLLSNTSVQSIIDHLKDLTGATAQTLTFHATVGAKLTDTQKAAISAKNWTLVY